MRYSASNQGEDLLPSYAAFTPGNPPSCRDLPDAAKRFRYSDEQFYVNSLQPPRNPNPFDSVAAKGKQVFQHQGCVACHAAPLFTSNKLRPADGLKPSEDMRKSTIFCRSLWVQMRLSRSPRGGVPDFTKYLA